MYIADYIQVIFLATRKICSPKDNVKRICDNRFDKPFLGKNALRLKLTYERVTRICMVLCYIVYERSLKTCFIILYEII